MVSAKLKSYTYRHVHYSTVTAAIAFRNGLLFSLNDTNKGNFVALLELSAKTDEVLKHHLETANRNAKYTSKIIQEDIIKTVGEMLREHITEPLRTGRSPFFAVIADEVTDKHANQEVLSVCIRYVDVSQTGSITINEELLDFAHLKRTTGEAVGNGILEVLRSANLNLQ